MTGRKNRHELLYPLGVTPTEEGAEILVQAEGKKVSLLLFRRGEKKAAEVIDFQERDRVGDVWSMTLRGYDLENMEFNTEKKVVQKAEGNTLPLTVAMFDNDAVFFEHTNSHRVSFLNTHTGKGVTMDYPDFESIAFWTPAGGNAPFLCLEPWNGSAIFHQDSDIFSEKRGILSLMPEAEKTYHLKITLEA